VLVSEAGTPEPENERDVEPFHIDRQVPK